LLRPSLQQQSRYVWEEKASERKKLHQFLALTLRREEEREERTRERKHDRSNRRDWSLEEGGEEWLAVYLDLTACSTI